MQHRPVKDRPTNNRAQNKQVDDAARDEGLDDLERIELGEIIEYESRELWIDHDYHTIRKVAHRLKRGDPDE